MTFIALDELLFLPDSLGSSSVESRLRDEDALDAEVSISSCASETKNKTHSQ